MTLRATVGVAIVLLALEIFLGVEPWKATVISLIATLWLKTAVPAERIIRGRDRPAMFGLLVASGLAAGTAFFVVTR